MVGEFVDRDTFADQRHQVTAPHGILVKISDVDRGQVHRNPARNRAALAGDHHFGAAGAIVGAGGTEISVSIARGHDRYSGRPPRGPGPAIADGLAALDVADLHDARLQLDDRLHRIVGFGRRIDAVEGASRPHQIEHELGAQENTG